MFTEYYAVLFTQLEWLANVTHASVLMTTLTDIYDDVNCSTFTSWLFIFIWMSVILPICLLLIIYVTNLSVPIYGLIYGLKEPSPNDSSWSMIMYAVSLCWHRFGRLWHGYEIEGLENVPSEGAALMVYYHGACPVDMYFMLADIYLFRNRSMRPVVDRFMFKVPGWEGMMNLLQAIPGSIESCTNILKEGHLMSIAPGGVYEAQFSDSSYRLQWRNRLGYAKVAIESKSPIIPTFTVNLREAYRTVSIGQHWFKKWYLKWRLPFAPIYGGYPVKLRTIIGKPIPYDPTLTAEELDRKVVMAVEKLIKDNQRLPGSIVNALLDRVYFPKKVKVA